jgi:hypothetical protein
VLTSEIADLKKAVADLSTPANAPRAGAILKDLSCPARKKTRF